MRLKHLRLRRYGCFDDADLALATEPGRITMIVAPNGAGKSVLRRAFHDLLFDIPLQSPMKFRHGYPGMELHAEAIDRDGATFEFGWVRGGKPPRATTDAARFAALQRGVTPQQLERLFALDTAGLRKGGTDLRGGMTLAGALLAGTGELAPAKSVRALIEARRQANWGAGKSKPPLNAASGKLDACRKRLREAVQRPQKREQEEGALEEARRTHEALKQERDGLLAEARRFNRVALVRPHLQHLKEAEEWLAAHLDVPALPAGLDQRLADARGTIATARATDEGAQNALRLATDAADSVGRDPAAIDLVTRLADLPEALGKADQAINDIGLRRAELKAKLDDMRSVLREIGTAVPVELVNEIIPTVGLVAEVRAAITQEAGLRKAFDLAVEGVANGKRAQAAAAAAPVAMNPLPEGLAVLLGEVRGDRNPIQHASEVAEMARAATAEVNRLLALVPGWTGGAEALRALPPPSEPAFDRMDAVLAAAEADEAKARADRSGTASRVEDARRALSELRGRPLPDDAAVAAARAERDRGMHIVLRRAFAAPVTPDEEEKYAGGEPVAVVYERQVRAADAIADQRAAELERVREAERLGRVIADLAKPLEDAGAAEAAASDHRRQASAQWERAVVPLRLEPVATMAEVRAFIGGRARVIDAMGAAEKASGAEAAVRAVHGGWADRLASMMALPPGPLGALLGPADAWVTSVRNAENAALKRQAAVDAVERGRTEADAAQVKAEAALQEWAEDWAGLLERLHRPAGEAPAAVAAVLGSLVTLEQHQREASSLQKRIEAMQDNLDRFAAHVATLSVTFGEPAMPTAGATARKLIARAAAAANAESASEQARLALDQARTSAEAGAEALAKAEVELRAVIAACGAASGEEAEQRIAAFREHAAQAVRRDAARNGLVEHGDGVPEAALRAEADAVPAGELATRRRDAEDAATAANTKAEEAAIRSSQLKTAFDAGAEATAAIDARADYEASAAEFGRRLEEQLVLDMASGMLADAMKAVEEELGGSSLDRVSTAFAAVTAGAYGLKAEDGAEGEELYAVEHAYPKERKSLDELSEGTRDQLYLALRMVALQDHCATATALPFLADDILQTFDDVRAAAALRAMLRLSNDMQVIILTHHEHLCRVMADTDEGGVHLINL